MNERTMRAALFTSLFLFPLLFLGLSWFMFSRVTELGEEIGRVQKELSLYGRQVMSTERRITMYKDVLAAVNLGTSETPESGVELFSIVQRHLTANGVLSRVIDEAGKPTPQGDRGVRISFEGAYPAFIRTLADWRQMEVALRVKQLSITGQGDLVKGDILLETIFGK
ncbi:hypothetical protein [Dethiosulfovibrio salsuginis]|uniref:Uncharacterized protein n=1 Tax=Dethiosulfovibrio salsuginis TaxID=561720 RepID=A0A1X7I185_9BACT|nr:hypothetical protein [Dethiosulfovibrio salsuginis]SMG08163.1 hypothetical protein SAMN06275492_10114 [Dethiosulfovibrio salsuginis]